MIGLSPLPAGHRRRFQPTCVRPSTGSYPRFSLPTGSSPGFASAAADYGRPFRTRFRSGSLPSLTSPTASNSLAHSTKGTPSHLQRVLRRLAGARFQVLFHSPPGVLFTFPSRYWCAIGHMGVFRLGGWSPRVRTGFHVPGPTQVPALGFRARVRLRGPNPVPPAFPCRSAPLHGSPPGAPAPGRRALQPRRRYRLAPARSPVWPRSPFARRYSGNLAVDFLSSGYLDVSVPRVVLPQGMSSQGGCQDISWRVRPFGDPRVEGCVPLTADYRSLPRPSSASCAKASAVRPTYLPAHLRRGRCKLQSQILH